MTDEKAISPGSSDQKPKKDSFLIYSTFFPVSVDEVKHHDIKSVIYYTRINKNRDLV